MGLKVFFKSRLTFARVGHHNPLHKNSGKYKDTDYEYRKYPNSGSGDLIYSPSHVATSVTSGRSLNFSFAHF